MRERDRRNSPEVKKPDITNTGVIIVAAGNGLRLGGDTPKAFIDLAGTIMCIRAIKPFDEMGFKEKVLVVPEKWLGRAGEIVKEQKFAHPVKVVVGGERRIDSVQKGVKALENTEWVMVHDGDRPFVTKQVINAVLEASSEFLAVVPGISPSDTVRMREGNYSSGTLDRNNLVLVQTPQRFHLQALREAFKTISPDKLMDVTDEATLFEYLGEKVGIVDGDQLNSKITYNKDLVVAEIMAGSEVILQP